jgi:hypothetical protein
MANKPRRPPKQEQTAPHQERWESLLTPFNIQLYGRVIQGISIQRQHLNGRFRERAFLRALQRKHAPGEQPSSGFQEAAASYDAGAFTTSESRSLEQASLANIYGYARGGTRTVLPRPVAYLVDNEGEAAVGWDQFPAAKGFRCWEVEPGETTLRFEVRPGSFNELLLAGEPSEQPVAGAAEPEGGILIRGADNRLYMIPLALEPFEVTDPSEISRLQVEAPFGREIRVDSVRSLTGRSTLVARSTLQVRSTLTLRSTLVAAANR